MKVGSNNYSYSVVKMFINQFALAIFGSSLTFATAEAHTSFQIIVSVFSMCFYLFLIYNIAWEIGARDKISVDVKKKPYRPYLGIVLSLLANIPNLILVIIYAITTITRAASAKAMVGLFSCLLNGMYWGLLRTIRIPFQGETVALQAFWVSFLVATLPAIITSGIAYYLGHKNFQFFGFITDKKPKVTDERPNMK